jgi:limonene 1,2-monooxygenase
MEDSTPMRFGIFLAPFHPVGQSPTAALQRDLEMIQRLDDLGYDEAWIGEHHSAGYEIIASPEVFIAVAAERTRRIRFGTGVSSLPYHQPLMLADRMVLLDHLTRGRVMLGCGPGSLPSDAWMMGIDPLRQRDMMEESLEAIMALLADEKPVDREAGWFTLRDARLQLRPYTQPHFPVAVAATISPAGPRAAGRFGCGLLSLSATVVQGFDVLGQHWQIMEERAEQFGTTVDREDWRLVGPMHLAPTAEQAREEVRYGIEQWVDYFRRVAALPLAPEGVEGADAIVDALVDNGFAVIGTPEQAVAQLQRLEAQTGGFGTYLLLAHDWADPQATLRSYELLASHVMPALQDSARTLTESRDWAVANRADLMGGAGAAIMQAIQQHAQEKSQQS